MKDKKMNARAFHTEKMKLLFMILMIAVICVNLTACDQYANKKRTVNSDEIIRVNVLIEPSFEFDHVFAIREGLAAAQKNDKFGFIDKHGNTVLPFVYDEPPFYFQEGMGHVWKRGEGWGFIDMTGELVIPYQYSLVDPFQDGLTRARKDGKFGFIDKTGDVVIPFIYDEAVAFYEGFVNVKKDDDWFLIDRNGEVIASLGEYIRVSFFSDGLAQMQQGGKYGFINISGEIAIPFIYDHALDFSDGLAKVKKDKIHFLIDTAGGIVASLAEYDSVGFFKEGLAWVSTEDPDGVTSKCGFIDKSGEIVIPLEYNYVSDFSEGLALALIDGKYGYIDKNNNVIVPFEYDWATDFSEGLAWVQKDGKWGLLEIVK